MNVYKGLLFLQGHLIRPEDLEDVPLPVAPPAAAAPARPHLAGSHLRTCFGWLENVLLLGGRPMRADRVDDIEPPLDLLLRDCGAQPKAPR